MFGSDQRPKEIPSSEEDQLRKPEERREAIEAINAKIEEIAEEKGTVTKEQSLKELQESFGSDQRPKEISSSEEDHLGSDQRPKEISSSEEDQLGKPEKKREAIKTNQLTKASKENTSEKDQLTKTSKDVENMRLNEALSDAESYTAFDYCE